MAVPYSLRRTALDKLAALSAKSPPGTSHANSDLSKLCRKFPTPPINAIEGGSSASRVPMSGPELEVLLAVCKAAPLVRDTSTAELLFRQLSPYLPESHAQSIAHSPSIKGLSPSPWELLTSHLTSALLALGNNHSSLRSRVVSTLDRYIVSCQRVADSMSAELFERDTDETDAHLNRMAILSISLLGFLDAATKSAIAARLWNQSELLRLVVNLRNTLRERFMYALEMALGVIRSGRSLRATRDWRGYLRHYAATGRPLGAMLLQRSFMELVAAAAGSMVADPQETGGRDILDVLRARDELQFIPVMQSEPALLEQLVDIAADQIRMLEEGSDYLRSSSAFQHNLLSSVRGSSFITYLCCSIVSDDIADPDILLSWLEATLLDSVQIADEHMAATVLKSMTVLAKTSPANAANLSRLLPRAIVQRNLAPKTSKVAAEALASILKLLTQDAVITTLYSLGNVLSAGNIEQKRGATPLFNGNAGAVQNHTDGLLTLSKQVGSAISLAPGDSEEPSGVYANVVQTIVGVAISTNDDKIGALAQSMLIQKVGRVNSTVDAIIIAESGRLGAHSAPAELRSLLKLYGKLCQDSLIKDNARLFDAVKKARHHLSVGIKRHSPLYEVYLVHLLDTIISKGDVQENDGPLEDTELATGEIASLLDPLSTLVMENADGFERDLDQVEEKILHLQRDAWFNIVVHGFTVASPLGLKYHRELQVLARASRPLVAEARADQLESDVELNTVLRRGKSPNHLTDQKRRLIEALPSREAQIKSLGYPEVVFLNAAYLVENLRATAGDSTKALHYFLDSKLRNGPMGTCMYEIAQTSVATYISRTVRGEDYAFSAPFAAKQLATIFAACCHRIPRVQQVAYACADAFIHKVPSALCQKTSLFALLELLTMMWTGCLDMDTDEYEWKSIYKSRWQGLTVNLPDSYDYRQRTLVQFHKQAREWVVRVLDVSPLDVKGLLQTYLSEFDDEGAYGHVSLGRSFALEMGSVVPQTDQRLGAIERPGGLNFDAGSDFIAQYTTRQEYRFVDGLQESDQEWLKQSMGQMVNGASPSSPLAVHKRSRTRLDVSMEEALNLLSDIEARTIRHKFVSVAELRDVLRRAAALLCRVNRDQCAIVHHLVGVPFAVFTKQSIKLGMSLWMTVIKENPRMESRILVEIAECWESTVRKRMGLFSDRLKHADPFFAKMEFAPSDKEALIDRRQSVYNLIAPHFRLLQFLSSHFNATRMSSPHVQQIYYRLMHLTLSSMRNLGNHPLAREVHFHIVLLGFRVLQFGTTMDKASQWRLRDRILSAALSWFRTPPRWSFGGNRVQIKAETHLLSDVQVALHNTSAYGVTAEAAMRSLQPKQELLNLLLSSEQNRLLVWLFPMENERKHHMSLQHYRIGSDAILQSVLKTAWREDPAIAIQMVPRYQSKVLAADVRQLILHFPEAVLSQPDALEMMLGSSLPKDLPFQLKYLLFWGATNPVSAATYFLPAYGNHPFIIQYAMRAMESHAVDVTFFYVPQIVQALRYDVLGYVQRYIVDTAKFSQLFAHQIIWNMKANMYKDEDSQIPDSIKPTLDTVLESLVSSFSKRDKSFYEREFTFFNEVTSISGKLRPFIKAPKQEKKEKIEEELRQIKVDVGVYLPSNPDGVVIGIDRKSGKPLQSHAKAPYMATFRIRKERKDSAASGHVIENGENVNGSNGALAVNGRATPMMNGSATTNGDVFQDSKENYYDIWQSAIFKVGDDCRQDVLALQMIAAFRNIFNSVGLDVFVNPYRVTATAPGCGVIDVLPNSISRDMLGREAVNGLFDYFASNYGGDDSIQFQEARSNFVKSMAAYSIISYLLQFKDRHNGNIMIDDAGHILHIDFGFCFDVAPGGIKFERAPFKLTSEMVAVMGGNTDSQAYHWFEELAIKAFLACRPYCEHLSHIVQLMLDSGLPCFKPETIQHFKERFVRDKSERDAADFVKGLIKKSYSSTSTSVYDQFQLMTNGIPF